MMRYVYESEAGNFRLDTDNALAIDIGVIVPQGRNEDGWLDFYDTREEKMHVGKALGWDSDEKTPIDIDSALERLKQIEWAEIGKKGDERDGDLFAEFMRRLALCFQRINLLKITNPMFRFYKYCGCLDESVKTTYMEILKKNIPDFPTDYGWHIEYLPCCFLKLAADADSGSFCREDLEIFEPIWLILQRGGLIKKEGSRGIEVRGAGYYTFADGWNETILTRKPLDLSLY